MRRERAGDERKPIVVPEAESMRDDHERRKSTRYVPVIKLVDLGWWEGSVFRTVTGWLRDLSFGGAAVVTDSPLPRETPLWLFLPALPESEWAQARIVGITTDDKAGVRTRLQFPGNCPYGLFKTLVWGIDPEEAATTASHSASSVATLTAPVALIEPSRDLDRPTGEVVAGSPSFGISRRPALVNGLANG
jgi:hypothetical protein